MNIITRGFGKIEEATVYETVSVCEPSAVSHAHGELCMEIKKLKPAMRAKTPSYIYEETEI